MNGVHDMGGLQDKLCENPIQPGVSADAASALRRAAFDRLRPIADRTRRRSPSDELRD
jgi:hypothetical protein